MIADARWIIAKKKGIRASTLVVVYPIAGLRRTVIQTAWDLTDYPSAWPGGQLSPSAHGVRVRT